MKVVIQIPCFNEAKTLPGTLEDLPRFLPGVDEVEVLVIDDGSTDGTAAVASEAGVQQIRRLSVNRGLANAFAVGLRESTELGADVVVNTDGDNQYRGEDISALVEPILNGEADMVVGDRQVGTIEHFSPMKKLLQKLGSWVVRWTSGTGVPDATSGFRAFSREAALQLVVFSNYTYTLETIIQAGKRGLTVQSIPIKTNPKKRESRLIRSIPRYVLRSASTILRIFLMYEALRVFLAIGSALAFTGLLLWVRFGYFFLIGEGSGHVQSLIAATVLMTMGFQAFLLGLLADIIARNRQMIEEMNYKLRKL
jgi:glycosyltransferase involved in cell wall biosynthesis